jgi:hypothetical protein
MSSTTAVVPTEPGPVGVHFGHDVFTLPWGGKFSPAISYRCSLSSTDKVDVIRNEGLSREEHRVFLSSRILTTATQSSNNGSLSITSETTFLWTRQPITRVGALTLVLSLCVFFAIPYLLIMTILQVTISVEDLGSGKYKYTAVLYFKKFGVKVKIWTFTFEIDTSKGEGSYCHEVNVVGIVKGKICILYEGKCFYLYFKLEAFGKTWEKKYKLFCI